MNPPFPFPMVPNFYTAWLKPGWSVHPKPAQIAAEQEWEGEGGSVRQAAPMPEFPH